MRKEYFTLALNELKKGRLGWLVAQGWKYVAMKPSFKLGRPLTGPVLGSILVTFRCNNACSMCDYPARAGKNSAKGMRELNTAQMKDLLLGFKRIGTAGMAFSGGEPLLREDIYELIGFAKKCGMVTNINTNGNLLAERDHAHRLLNSGVDLINISVDGANAETHDYLRESPGGFDKIMQAIPLLNELRTSKRLNTKLNMVTVLGKDNIDQTMDILELGRKLEVDDIGFMPMHLYGFQNQDLIQSAKDPAFLKKAEGYIEKLKEISGRYSIDSSRRYLDLFLKCFNGEKNPLLCYAGYNSLMVDCYGRIYPCFPWIEEGKTVGNVLETDLPTFWTSKKYNEDRKEIAKCHSCFWNCHTEMNLMFN